jgi:hypothetical protein
MSHRKRFLYGQLAMLSLWLPASASAAPEKPVTLTEIKVLRKQAAHKKRRIVFHSDGMHMESG